MGVSESDGQGTNERRGGGSGTDITLLAYGTRRPLSSMDRGAGLPQLLTSAQSRIDVLLRPLHHSDVVMAERRATWRWLGIVRLCLRPRAFNGDQPPSSPISSNV